MNKYNYRYTGCVYAYGPIYADSIKAAKDQIRQEIRQASNNSKARLPNGFEIWRT